jgi:glycerol kinase
VHACDTSNASRTLLFNIEQTSWDADLLSLFDIPSSLLPNVQASDSHVGDTQQQDGIPGGVPMVGILGDSHAALFAHAAFQPGRVKATYGTGSSLMTPIPRLAFDTRISSTIAWTLAAQTQYAFEGNISSTGAAIQWLGEFLQLPDPVRDTSNLAMEVEHSNGVFFVPALAGLGAPHWDDKARGLISGLTRASKPAHLARATLESIAFQIRDVLEAMEQAAGQQMSVLLADGGATENELLMQIQADTIGRPVICSRARDLSAQGVAWIAGLGTGFWHSLSELEAIAQPVDRYEPRLSDAARERKYEQWRSAVQRALTGSAPRAMVCDE